MRIKTILKASFTLCLVALCTVAAVALIATPAAEARILLTNNCPPPCPPGFSGVSSGETCSIWQPDCLQVCRVWRTSGGGKCYTDCNAV